MELVERTNSSNVPGRRGPLVDVRRQLFRLAPQNPAGGLFLVEPFAMSGGHEVVADGGDAFFVELAADGIVLPELTLVDHQGFQFVLRVEAQDEFPPQRQLLLPRRFHGLDREEGREGIKFGILRGILLCFGCGLVWFCCDAEQNI